MSVFRIFCWSLRLTCVRAASPPKATAVPSGAPPQPFSSQNRGVFDVAKPPLQHRTVIGHTKTKGDLGPC
jgi:hypothetical protein